MRAPWEAVHAGLCRSVRTVRSRQLFDELKLYCPTLGRFPDVASLIGYLLSDDADLDEENGIYAALVVAAQAPGRARETAMAILMVALWPGLDAIYRRSFRYFLRDDPEAAATELSSEITARFAALVGEADLIRIRKVAATLVLNTQRQVTDGRRRTFRDLARWADEPDDDAFIPPGTPQRREPSDLGIAPGHTPEEERAAIRRWLEAIVGRDAELVLAVVIDNDNMREAGERVGISHDLARKRFPAAIERIQAHFRRG